MKVFIWAGGHTISESLYQNPPKGVVVIGNIQDYSTKTGVSGERVSIVPKALKDILDGVIYSACIPRFLPLSKDSDLIHTIGGLVPITPKPWITTISIPSAFFGLNDDWHESRRRKWVLSKILRSRNCRGVTCYSRSTLDGFKATLGNDISESVADKLSVLYPAIDSTRFTPKRNHDEGVFRILFVGNHFFDKGGRELHRAVSRLVDKYDVELDIVTDAPPHHKEALISYMNHHQEEWVNWYVPGLSRRRLIEEFFPAADAFVMCSYMEVFGFVFLEAMASGLPVIGANVYAQREIISHGENGYLIDVPISPYHGDPPLRTQESIDRYLNVILEESYFDSVVTQISSRLATLIEERTVRNRMSTISRKMTTEGKFSIRSRNERLISLYKTAIQ